MYVCVCVCVCRHTHRQTIRVPRVVQTEREDFGQPRVEAKGSGADDTDPTNTPPVSDNCKKKVKVLVAQSCLTLCNPIDCSPTGSSVCGILQARILEWVTIPFSRGSFRPRGFTGRFASQITEKAPNPAIMTLVLWYNL